MVLYSLDGLFLRPNGEVARPTLSDTLQTRCGWTHVDAPTDFWARKRKAALPKESAVWSRKREDKDLRLTCACGSGAPRDPLMRNRTERKLTAPAHRKILQKT